jgi:cardiolipin synthase A/B
MLHAKSMTVDGSWAVVGSANADMRSFRLNFEMSVLIAEPEFAARLERRFEEDLGASREVRRADASRASFLRRLGRGAARLLSPFL